MWIVDTDDRRRARPRACEYGLLGGDVAVHAAMAAEVIWRYVEKHGDIKHYIWRQLQLI